jgi:hypothetical protein
LKYLAKFILLTFFTSVRGQVIKRSIDDARAALAAAVAQEGEEGDKAASAALGLVAAALEISPRMEAALEIRARALLALRRYRDVADMLRDYIPSYAMPCATDNNASLSSSSGCGDNADTSCAGILSRFLCFSKIKRHVNRSNAETQWR